jgi:hypothetical protein
VWRHIVFLPPEVDQDGELKQGSVLKAVQDHVQRLEKERHSTAMNEGAANVKEYYDLKILDPLPAVYQVRAISMTRLSCITSMCRNLKLKRDENAGLLAAIRCPACVRYSA